MPTVESTTSRELSISVFDCEGGALIRLNGRISIGSSPGLRNRLLQILDRESLSTLTIDLTAVTYIDLSGVATLVEALKISRRRKSLLQLRGLRDRPRYLLEVTGLIGLFETNGRINDSSASRVL